MSPAAFDPLELTIDASLRNVVLGDFECPQIAGLRAEDACSRDALLALATECGLLGLRPARLSDDLASAASSPDARTARAATTALVNFGRRLGALIATLRDPMTADAQGDTPGRRACLSHWLAVQSIWLAGGLVSGRCGPLVMQGVRAGAAAAARPCRVALAPYPEVAPLLGAAQRARGSGDGDVIPVADLGHTSIRTAIAERSAASLSSLRVHDVRAAPCGRSREEIADAVAEALAGVAARAADGASRRVRLIVSVAAYVAAGLPVEDGQSLYGGLGNQVTSLRRRVSAASRAEVIVEFVHDGTAAASITGSMNSATITVGTWLGVGFQATQGPPLLGLAPNLWIHGGPR